MNMQAKSQKYGHLIAAGGMVVALLSFFLFPFVTMSMPNSNPSPQAQPRIYSETFSALQAASIQGFVWLDALLVGVILLVALLLAFSHNPFDTSRVPLSKQIQWGIYAIIGGSVLSLLVQFIVMRTIPGNLIGMFSSTFSSSNSSQNSAVQSFINSTSMRYSVGSWLYLVGMLAAIGGAIYAFMSTRPSAVSPAQIPSPYMQPPASSPYTMPPTQQSAPPAWQQPNQPPSQYPPQPTQAAPEQYAPNQQPWQQTPPPQQPAPGQFPPNQPWSQTPPPQQQPAPEQFPPNQPPTEYR